MQQQLVHVTSLSTAFAVLLLAANACRLPVLRACSEQLALYSLLISQPTVHDASLLFDYGRGLQVYQ
jgi:hypothetical protein